MVKETLLKNLLKEKVRIEEFISLDTITKDLHISNLKTVKRQIKKLVNDWEDITDGTHGGFMKALAEAYIRADMDNREKIGKEFPELAASYEIWMEG